MIGESAGLQEPADVVALATGEQGLGEIWHEVEREVPGFPGPVGIRWDGVREADAGDAGVEQGDTVQVLFVLQSE